MRQVSVHSDGADLALTVGGVEDSGGEVLAVVGEEVVVVGNQVLVVEHRHQVEDAAFADGGLHFGKNVFETLIFKVGPIKLLKILPI